MRRVTSAATALVAFACLQSALAFSAFWSVDGWDTARLREAGISVSPWKHARVVRDPSSTDPLVQITLDCSRLSKDLDALMILHVVSDGKLVCTSYVPRTSADRDTLTLAFSVDREHMDLAQSDVWISLPGADQANAHAGYKISVKRILELARMGSPKD